MLMQVLTTELKYYLPIPTSQPKQSCPLSAEGGQGKIDSSRKGQSSPWRYVQKHCHVTEGSKLNLYIRIIQTTGRNVQPEFRIWSKFLLISREGTATSPQCNLFNKTFLFLLLPPQADNRQKDRLAKHPGNGNRKDVGVLCQLDTQGEAAPNSMTQQDV